MMVSTVKGRFGTLEGAVEIDEANPLLVVRPRVDRRREHHDERAAARRAPAVGRLLQRREVPEITFVSKRVERVDAENYRVVGDLTIRDVTKEVVLATEFEGQVRDPYGNQRAGFTATTQISRGDFGVNFNGLLETGGVIVSDKVKITLHIEAIRAA